MRTLFKLTFLIIGLVIISLLALPFVINPNDYKAQIAEQVEKVTGRKLAIDGDIGLSVFPWVALELGPLSLSNAKGFEGAYFAKVNKAEIRIKLIPILSQKLEMDTVILDGLVLNLQKNKAGTSNWDDLVTQTQTTQKNESSPSSDNQAPTLAAISIAGIKLSDASISWSDASTAQQFQLNNLNLATDPLVPGQPTTVDMEFDLLSQKPVAQVHVKLATKLAVDMEKQRYAMTEINLSTQMKGKNLPLDTADIALSGDISADLNKQLATVHNLLVNIDANKDKQNIKAKLSTDISSNLTTQQSQLKAVDVTLAITDPALPEGKINAHLSSDITADIKQQTVSISDLVLSVKDLLIKGDIKADKILSDNPEVNGQIQLKPFNLRQLAQNMAITLPVMTDDSTLSLVEVETVFNASAKHFNAQKLAVTLDQSHLNGTFSISNFANPAYRFKLALDEIDADRYLPPAPEKEKNIAPPASAATAGASQLPLETLRKINAKGTLDIGKLKINGLHSEKIHFEIHADKGVIQLAPLSANLYQGQYKGHVNLNAQGKVLKIALDEKLSSVQAGPLLKDLTGDDKLSGIANAATKLNGKGATVDQIKQTLSGTGNFAFKDGTIKGINIAESIRKAKAALKGKPYQSTGPQQTDFASLTGSFTAKNGLFSNKDLILKSPLLRVNGNGSVDLPKKAINYALKVAIVGTLEGESGKQLAELKGLTIPVKITGTFSNPKPTVDLASLLKEKAKAKIKAKAEEKLKGKLGGLGGLLGESTSDTVKSGSNLQEGQTTNTPKEQPKSIEEQAKDALKNKLKNLF